MDPITAIGAVASIAQLAQAAISLSKSLYSIGSAIKSAADDIKDLADDLNTFSQSLSLFARLLDDSKSWYSDDVYLLTAKIIKDCADLYIKIDKILVKLIPDGKSTWKSRVIFVHKDGEIKKLMKRLRDMKGTLATVLMSLQVDLQLSLLNISSASKLHRPFQQPLQSETIEQLKRAQLAFQATRVLVNEPSSSEKASTVYGPHDQTAGFQAISIQGIVHAFHTALEIQQNLMKERVSPQDADIHLAAAALKASLKGGKTQLERFHKDYSEAHGLRYLQLASQEPQNSKLDSFSYILMSDVVIKLHMLSAPFHKLHQSHFEKLYDCSEDCRKQALAELKRMVLLLTDTPATDQSAIPVRSPSTTRPSQFLESTNSQTLKGDYRSDKDDEPYTSKPQQGPGGDSKRVFKKGSTTLTRPLAKSSAGKPAASWWGSWGTQGPAQSWKVELRRSSDESRSQDSAEQVCSPQESVSSQPRAAEPPILSIDPQQPISSTRHHPGHLPSPLRQQAKIKRPENLGEEHGFSKNVKGHVDDSVIRSSSPLAQKPGQPEGDLSQLIGFTKLKVGRLEPSGAEVLDQTLEKRRRGGETRQLNERIIVDDLSWSFDDSNEMGRREVGAERYISSQGSRSPSFSKHCNSPQHPELATELGRSSNVDVVFRKSERLWWQTFEQIRSYYPNIFEQLLQEIRVATSINFEYNSPEEDICKRLSSHLTELRRDLGTFPPEIRTIVELRDRIIDIVSTIERHLGLVTATPAWSCTIGCLRQLNRTLGLLSRIPLSFLSVTRLLSHYETTYSQLLNAVSITARYAVMENLYRLSPSLTLRLEYRAALLSLCTDLLRLFAAGFAIAHALGKVAAEAYRASNGHSSTDSDAVQDVRANIGMLNFLAEKVREQDVKCKTFAVVVDVEEHSGIDEDSPRIGETQDEGNSIVS